MGKYIEGKKLVADLFGNGIGIVATAYMTIKTYHFLKYGGIIFYEQNRLISLTEFLASIFGVSYFGYKLGKMCTKKGFKEYQY